MLTLHLLTFKIITVMGKIIKFLLICLGFKSLTACDTDIWNGPAEYGTPYAEYEVKGRVSDSEGTPVSGIKVSMGDDTFDIQFTDIDGEAGGGLFEEQTVTVQAEMVEEGDGWDEGDYAVKEDVNVTLELKKDSEE